MAQRGAALSTSAASANLRRVTPEPARILVLFAHPAFHKSRIHRALVAAARDLPGVTFHDLYEAYPDDDLDVGREQGLLAAHDIVVWQHPFYWYSTPPILKLWQDLVLQHGWAYGSNGTALRGKTALSVISTGGGEPAYLAGGRNRYTMRQLLAPIDQTWFLCGVRYLPPFVVHGAHAMHPEALAGHAADYRRVLAGLRDGTLDLDAAAAWPRLNADMPALTGA